MCNALSSACPWCFRVATLLCFVHANVKRHCRFVGCLSLSDRARRVGNCGIAGDTLPPQYPTITVHVPEGETVIVVETHRACCLLRVALENRCAVNLSGTLGARLLCFFRSLLGSLRCENGFARCGFWIFQVPVGCSPMLICFFLQIRAKLNAHRQLMVDMLHALLQKLRTDRI